MSRFAELVTRLEAHRAAGHWRGVLLEATNTVIALVQDARAKAVVFGSPELDAFCQWAGAQANAMLGAMPETPFDDSLCVYIATELMQANGGHTLALRDVIHARPNARHVVLVSNLHDKELNLPDLAQGQRIAVQCVVAPPGELGQKTLWLLQALRHLRPGRLVLFNHHHDSACVAAAQPGVAGQTIYFHHCDHDMALGPYLPHAVHVDCSNVMVNQCGTRLGVADPHYWPLVAHDQGPRGAEREWLAEGLVTCSHGSPVKFLSLGRWAYIDVIARRLRDLPGKHIHVGGLPEPTLATWREQLARQDIDPARFEHVGPVPDLWQWLKASPVDIVISSFPVQGYKGLVETMGAGLPVAMLDGNLTKLHSTLDLVYEEALAWRHPDELLAGLAALDAPALARHASASRAHYEAWHHPRELAYAVNNPRLSAPMPPCRPFRPDTLALYWR